LKILKNCSCGDLMRAKLQENRLRQELIANQPLMDHLVGLRERIPRHSEDLFEFRIDWELLKDVW
jgi:hypothetical protein